MESHKFCFILFRFYQILFSKYNKPLHERFCHGLSPYCNLCVCFLDMTEGNSTLGFDIRSCYSSRCAASFNWCFFLMDILLSCDLGKLLRHRYFLLAEIWFRDLLYPSLLNSYFESLKTNGLCRNQLRDCCKYRISFYLLLRIALSPCHGPIVITSDWSMAAL